MSGSIPIVSVRVELEGMELQMKQAILTRFIEIEKDIEKSISLAIKNFDLQGSINKQIQIEMDKELKGMVGSAITTAVWGCKSDIQEKMRAIISKKLEKELKNAKAKRNNKSNKD